MKCGYSQCAVEFFAYINRNGTRKVFCSAACKTKGNLERKYIQRKHPKRQRDRKRERLYTVVNRKVRTWGLERLVALFGEEEIAARYDTWVDHMILRGIAEGRGVAG